MNELVKRLRKSCFLKATHPHFGNIADDCMEAADRIIELEARLKAVKALVKERIDEMSTETYYDLIRAVGEGNEQDRSSEETSNRCRSVPCPDNGA